MARRGPVPKGDRDQFTFKLPKTHLEFYRDRAREAGLPLGDYLATRLAADHELGELGYAGRASERDQFALEGVPGRRAS